MSRLGSYCIYRKLLENVENDGSVIKTNSKIQHCVELIVVFCCCCFFFCTNIGKEIERCYILNRTLDLRENLF